jgi:UDP-N-acetylglucosamine/UDP-N-acetylgalactosamine diphosphorylase
MEPLEREKISKLMAKGARILDPESVFIGEEVSLDRLAGDGVVIYPGCRIMGKKALLMSGVKLGSEGPVTVEDCQIGPHVELKGGFFKKSTFLERASMGSGALVRDGCLLEEQSSGAHSVGLKQTILFPFVTLGSLINFCDCLMGGGTSRKNHSEVGSSYIHFNYTPNQDKATPSMIGDVPRGVMLKQPPIFLGGQGGIVGPSRVAYGSVVAAGIVCRKDILKEGRLLLGQDMPQRYDDAPRSSVKFHPGVYWHVKRQVVNNLHFIAHLIALRHWYVQIRSLFFRGGGILAEALYAGAVEKLDMAIEERTNRFKDLAEKMPESVSKMKALLKKQTNQRLVTHQKELFDHWQDLEGLWQKHMEESAGTSDLEGFLAALKKNMGQGKPDYIAKIQQLDETVAEQGTRWLQGIVDAINEEAFEILPSFICD